MRISLLVFTLVVGISCTVSYKFNGGNINYDKVKTISIADFPIKSDYVYAPLGTKFNEDLKDIFLRQTRLKLVNNNADLEIDGEITGYNQDFEQQFSAFRVYDSRELLTAVQDGLIAEMTKEITDQIFNATVANW